MTYKQKSVVIWIEGINDLEADYSELFENSLDPLVKDGGIQFLLQRKEYTLFQTLTRLTHLIEYNDKPEPKSFMIREFFCNSSKSFKDMFKFEMMLCTNDKSIIDNECSQYQIKDSHYITSSENILEILSSFQAQKVYPLLFIHIDCKKSHEISLSSLLNDIFTFINYFIFYCTLADIDSTNINIVLSPLKEWEEKDFNPPVEEESIVASIIPKQTFNFYMFDKIEVDFSKWSLLIQYDKGVTRKFGEFDTLQDVLQFTLQRQSNYGVLKSKTYLGDNFMQEIAFKQRACWKFGA